MAVSKKKSKVVETFNGLPKIAKAAIILGGLFVVYKGVKRITKGPITGKVKNIYLTGGEGIPQTGTDTQGKPVYWSPTELIEELHSTMDGWTDSTSSKEAAWGKLKDLPSNDMVLAVYEGFNQLYGKDYSDYPTLTKWIDSEWGDIVGMNKAGALKRLRDQGLTQGVEDVELFYPVY